MPFNDATRSASMQERYYRDFDLQSGVKISICGSLDSEWTGPRKPGGFLSATLAEVVWQPAAKFEILAPIAILDMIG